MKNYYKRFGRKMNITKEGNEVYTDLENLALTKEELVDKLIALAHDTHHNELFGELVREELLKFDRQR